MAGTVLFGVVAAVSLLAFITVRWPGGSGRVVMAFLLFSVVGVIACAAAAVLTAARVTYVSSAGTKAPADESTERPE